MRLSVEDTKENIVEEAVVEDEMRRIILNVDEEGQIKADFEGGFKTYEAIGILGMSIFDFLVQSCINPSLKTVISSQKASEQNLLQVLQSVYNEQLKPTEVTTPTSELGEGLRGLVEKHAG